MENENYINIQGWMINDLNLKGNELLLYAIIYGFSQNGEGEYYGSQRYISKALKISLPTANKLINSLLKKGLIIKKEESHYQAVFKREETEVLKKVKQGVKETLTVGVKETLTVGVKETLTNKYNTNNNNTLEPSAQVCEDITYVPLEEEIKGLKKQPIVKDPKVEERKAIIGYFIRKSKEIHGYCPQISLVPTLKLIKTLQSFNSEVDLRELIDWFLQSDLYDNLGSDIKICFSLASYNKFMDYKRKH